MSIWDAIKKKHDNEGADGLLLIPYGQAIAIYKTLDRALIVEDGRKVIVKKEDKQ